jgi:predicted ATPase
MEQEQVFVGREAELDKLEAFLDRARTGQGQICFVSGQAGAGKTTLVSQYARRAQTRHDDQVVVLGACDAQTGAGDAYLPFREILKLLSGDVDSTLAQGRITGENARRLRDLVILTGEVLVEVGPDLIGLFVPGATLLAEAGQFLMEKSGWPARLKERLDRKKGLDPEVAEGLDQAQIFEQYINVLHGLARQRPLILVLEDLQWADSASIGLLFRLGRRLEGQRIHVVGTYRPDDVALGRDGQRHPLQAVLAEMKRYFGDVEVDLDRATASHGREFVDAYLDTSLNCLDDAFRQGLFEHTGGHPLFTAELLRHMQERGDLVQDEDGCWGEGPGLDWTDLPSRVEGVIAERIGRLAGHLREYLAVASVEGEQFTAEVIAQVQSLEARNLVRHLSGELQKEHHLVESQGVQRLGPQRLSRYRFLHNLMQAYLYGSLDEVQLSYLHEDVGHALEAFYGDEAGQIAIQLARHFEQAGVPERARHYLQQAGEQAAARFANAEAVSYLSRALALTPETEQEVRYRLLRTRERVYDLQGEREAQAGDLEALERLAEQLGDRRYQAEVALRRAAFGLSTGRYREAIAAARESARYASQAGDPLAQARAYHRWGRGYWSMGEYRQARQHLEKALALSQDHDSPLDQARCLYDLGVVDHYQGDYKSARRALQQGLALYDTLGDRRGQIRCQSTLGILSNQAGDYAGAGEWFTRALHLCREVGWRYAEARILTQSANNLFDTGDLQASRDLHRQTYELYTEIGDEEGKAVSLDSQGLAATYLGEPEQALELFKEALGIHRAIDNRRGMGYVLTHLGYALAEARQWAAARRALEKALTLRRETDAGGLVVDTLAGLARVALGQGEPSRALPPVIEILSWIEANGTGGIEYVVQVYLICYRVLHSQARQRPEMEAAAQRVLKTGHDLLMERAGRIQDGALRDQFLRNIPFNRELYGLWRAQNS